MRLLEGPFEGLWIGLSADWAETVPCDPVDLAYDRLWICLTSPASRLLASQLLEARAQGRLHTAE